MYFIFFVSTIIVYFFFFLFFICIFVNYLKLPFSQNFSFAKHYQWQWSDWKTFWTLKKKKNSSKSNIYKHIQRCEASDFSSFFFFWIEANDSREFRYVNVCCSVESVVLTHTRTNTSVQKCLQKEKSKIDKEIIYMVCYFSVTCSLSLCVPFHFIQHSCQHYWLRGLLEMSR